MAHIVWNNLHKNYSKTDVLLASKLIQELHILNLKEESDPTNFFENISTIQMQTSKITDYTISEKEICPNIITTALKMYMPVIRALQEEKGSSLEIEDLEEEMCELYRIWNINEESDIKD